MSLYVETERDRLAAQATEEVVVRNDESEGWYVQVDEGLDVFASGPGERRCNGEPGGAEWRCQACGAETDDPSIDTTQCPEREDGTHDWWAIPLSWANSAHITFDEDNDQILVSISVGDPRGRFVMRVERVMWEDPEGRDAWKSSLRLAVPAPTDSMPHMELRQLASDGYFEITNHSATY